MTGRISAVTIRTPEGIAFSLPLAGPISRLLALAVDMACVAATATAIGQVLSLFQTINADTSQAVAVLSYFVISVGYGIVAEWHWRGRTLGKWLLGLRVMDQQGLQLQVNQIVARNLLRFVDALPAFYLLGGVVCLLSRHLQRLGDLAANTIVVRTGRQTQPDLSQLLEGKFNSLLEYHRLAARLRQRVSPAIAGVALEALLRRDEFSPPARIELFRGLADHFRSLVEFPAEATEQLADEQYVRNVVEILFRPHSIRMMG